jgi:hypothetical protein
VGVFSLHPIPLSSSELSSGAANTSQGLISSCLCQASHSNLTMLENEAELNFSKTEALQ